MIQPNSATVPQIRLLESVSSHHSLLLPAQEIHLWNAELTCSIAEQDEFIQSLSDDERQRASRFHFERDRSRFVAARGILRQLLGRYLDCAAKDLQFSYTKQGKPYLLYPSDSSLYFNLAHSFDRALFAFAHVEVGVDIEAVRNDIDIDLIAPSVFSPAEISEWQLLPQTSKRSAFFSLWTRKEAFVKAIGQGIGYPLQEVAVGFSVEPVVQTDLVSELLIGDQRYLLWDILAATNTRAALVSTIPPIVQNLR